MLGKVAVALTDVGEWDKAREVVEKIEGRYERAESLHEIANRLIKSEQLEQALSVLGEAERVAGEAGELWQRAELLCRVARSFLSANKRDQAERIWERAILAARLGENSNQAQESVDCSSVLREIAETIAWAGNPEKALEIAKAIKSAGKREKAMKAILSLLDQNGDEL